MVKLFCAIVGGQGSAFSVTIDASDSVDELKKAIKKEKENDLKAIDPDKLELFLAKKGDAWLDRDGAEAVTLDGHGYPEGFTHMDPLLWIKNPKNFGVNFEPNEGEIHVLVVVPATAAGTTALWLVRGSVANALSTKGVRCRVYRLAGTCLGYYDPTRRVGDKNTALWYEEKTLCIHILFETKENALQFENALRDEKLTIGSPLNSQEVTTRVDQVPGVPDRLQRIFYEHYVSQDTESPQDTMSSISLTSSVSILDASTDEFRYQRIEHERHFLPYGNAESCHLVSRKQSKDHKREFAKYDRDTNNRLALSREMHGFYDALSYDVPIVNMVPVPGPVEKPSIGSRYKVEVFVKVLDAQCTDRVFSRLKAGSTKTDDPLVMKTFVHVENPETFRFCMQWKHDENDERWKSFLSMTPAVD